VVVVVVVVLGIDSPTIQEEIKSYFAVPFLKYHN
jgi:hypothetical protein